MSFPTHIVACGGIVVDEGGNILLVKENHGGWVFPGGQVEVGENLEDGVIREVKEESGIDVVVSHLVGVYSNTGIHKWHDGVTDVPTKVMFDFVCEPIGGELTTSEETTDSRWVPKNDVLDWIEASAIRTRYQSYLDDERVKYMDYLTRPNFEVKRDREI
ncbi:NUDIX hydrolase [Alkalibacillus haloalkaliphilus]|uniref:Putative MutT/NUDIX-like protein n=1 Tax=Alkalibacillus haloalkaliphilus TaxID=94136 RepID=A0A511W7W2_9BACI|nr:NUDIX hydrolase [Alkalibacillus haloalkaliphilus]GEN46143.1 putative MutT/NUDIX-like protein [Alkalibacillus haloalkaliphilus]